MANVMIFRSIKMGFITLFEYIQFNDYLSQVEGYKNFGNIEHFTQIV